jgi:hypothetical protein
MTYSSLSVCFFICLCKLSSDNHLTMPVLHYLFNQNSCSFFVFFAIQVMRMQLQLHIQSKLTHRREYHTVEDLQSVLCCSLKHILVQQQRLLDSLRDLEIPHQRTTVPYFSSSSWSQSEFKNNLSLGQEQFVAECAETEPGGNQAILERK